MTTVDTVLTRIEFVYLRPDAKIGVDESGFSTQSPSMTRTPNPNANKFELPTGYRDIGWQVGLDNADKKKCHEAGHSQQAGQITEFDNSLFCWRCTDVIRLCSVCKIVDPTDMSD